MPVLQCQISAMLGSVSHEGMVKLFDLLTLN